MRYGSASFFPGRETPVKKFLMLLVLGGLAYWLVKDRLGGEPDEFIFTEAPPAGEAQAAASPPPPAV